MDSIIGNYQLNKKIAAFLSNIKKLAAYGNPKTSVEILNEFISSHIQETQQEERLLSSKKSQTEKKNSQQPIKWQYYFKL